MSDDRPTGIIHRLAAVERLLGTLESAGVDEALAAALGNARTTVAEARLMIEHDSTTELGRLSHAAPSFDLPFAEVDPADMPRFNLDDRDVAMADHITARALVTELEEAGAARFPVVLFTFEASAPDGRGGRQLVTTGETGLIGSPEMLRRTGKILRDTCNAAANRAEGT